jgi:hypothetical protein
MKKIVFPFVWLLLALPFAANAKATTGSVEDVLHAFAACNGEFFYSLKTNSESVSGVTKVKEGTRSASIVVESRRIKGKQSVRFTRPIDAYSLHLTGYFDEASAESPKEQFYYWGFFVAEKPADVRQRLGSHIKDVELLKVDGLGFVRLDMHDGQKWISIESPQQHSGTVPGRYIERVLLIEESDDPAFPGTRLSCSIQGPVSDIVLSDIRPDIPRSEYPRSLQSGGQDFDSAVLSQKVQDAAKKLSMNDLFRPKFRSASVKFMLVDNDNPKRPGKSEIVETFQVTNDGMIRKREIYSPNFFVDRLMLWNFVQLKAKMSTSEPYLTQEVKVTLPKTLEAGQILETETVAGPDYEQQINRSVCTVEGRIPANQVFRSLEGSAVRISCVDPVTTISRESRELVFLEDLGIFLERSSISKDYGRTSHEFTEFTYTR